MQLELDFVKSKEEVVNGFQEKLMKNDCYKQDGGTIASHIDATILYELLAPYMFISTAKTKEDVERIGAMTYGDCTSTN